MSDWRELLDLARRVALVVRTRQVTLLAAGVAFYAFLSLVPLMLLATGVVASLGGEVFVDSVAESFSSVLTPAARNLLTDALVDETSRQSATVVGAVGVLWGSSRVFRGLDRAFSAVYGTVAAKSFVDTFWDAVVVAFAITGGILLVGVLEVVLRLAPIPGIVVVLPALILPGLVAAFFPMYYVFPAESITAREALPGTILAVVGWLVLSRAFAVYATLVDATAIYGALGAVLLVLVWLYAAANLLILGAVVNAVLAGRDRDGGPR